MNPTSPANSQRQAPPAPGLSVDDVLFTLARHKWLLLAFLALGLAGAAAVRLVRPPLHVSEAKLMLHYVTDLRGPDTDSPENQKATRNLGEGARTIIANEVQIITSLDVAKQVAAEVGAQRILAKKGGGTNLLAAAGVVGSGLDVKVPEGSILSVSFKHPDGEVVQPVLEALIHAYMLRHAQLHQGWELEESYTKQRDDARKRLGEIEEGLKRLKLKANVLAVENTQRDAQVQLDKAREALREAQRELAEQKAMMGQGPAVGESVSPGQTNSIAPPDKLEEYNALTTELSDLQRQKLELLRFYKEAYPQVQTVQGRIDKLGREKNALEKAYPSLALTGAAAGVRGLAGTGVDRVSQLARLTARVAFCQSNLSNVQAQAWQVLDLQPQIAELERRRDEEQKMYDGLVSTLESKRNLEARATGKAANISVVQNPSPPGLDYKKLTKLTGAVLAACLALGVGLAFAIDLFLDRSLKRLEEVERHLHLPVFLTIPDAAQTPPRLLIWFKALVSKAKGQAAAGETSESGEGELAVAHWQETDPLQAYANGLRERIMTYFEVHDLNHKKPKLVAVTGCHRGAGVSTLASGLAASLSKTGDGNVLLVDMNNDQGLAQSFHQGKRSCGLSSALEPEHRSEAMVDQNLYVATLQGQEKNQPMAVAPAKQFNHLMPKLKASDYDYIIFDMPPVTMTSPTPRLASHMDMVLLVVEAEKTSRHAAERARELMRESRVQVAAVVNKQRQYLPTALAPEP